MIGEMMPRFFSCVILVFGLGLPGFVSQSTITQAVGKKNSPPQKLSAAEISALIKKVKAAPLVDLADNEIGVIETDLGRIVIEFFPKIAPQHCRNFKRLVNHGFYDGTSFHRVIRGFMIQGGDILSRDADPRNDGMGDPGYTVPAEFSNLPHERGVLSMARKGYNVNTAGSQFFICLAPAPHLNGQYTIFGRVVQGLEVVDKIVAANNSGKENPDHPVVMNKVKVVKRNEL
jgi:peptidyl-prolyl cis-trans isomerase B (cyclophilin B)